MPSKTADTIVPATSATKYIHGFPTTGNTNIPPCGAIKVHPKAIDKAPPKAEPIMHAGNTRSGSEAANGIAPSVINERPITKFVGPVFRSSIVYLFLKIRVESAIPHGGIMPPIITAAIIS